MPDTVRTCFCLLIAVTLFSYRTSASTSLEVSTHIHRHALAGEQHRTPRAAPVETLADGENHQHHRKVPACSFAASFAIDDAEVTERSSTLSADELRWHVDSIDVLAKPHVRVRVTNLPCVSRGCCNHTLLVRPQTSDATVLAHTIEEYRDFLDKLTPHVEFNTILDAGGNIRIATMVFANMYPHARIVALEPEQSNCLLLKANTLAFPNVKVHCKGLWDKTTQVAVVPGGDGKAWGWRIQAVPEGTKDAVSTVTVEGLLKAHELESFDFVKMDIEGAEFQLFGAESNVDWLEKTLIVAMEIHGWIGLPSCRPACKG